MSCSRELWHSTQRSDYPGFAWINKPKHLFYIFSKMNPRISFGIRKHAKLLIKNLIDHSLKNEGWGTKKIGPLFSFIDWTRPSILGSDSTYDSKSIALILLLKTSWRKTTWRPFEDPLKSLWWLLDKRYLKKLYKIS